MNATITVSVGGSSKSVVVAISSPTTHLLPSPKLMPGKQDLPR